MNDDMVVNPPQMPVARKSRAVGESDDVVVATVTRLRGNPGAKVILTLLRPSTGESKDYTLTREIINVPTVKDLNGHREFPVDEAKIGYIHLTQFGEHTTDDFESALQKLKKAGEL